MVVPTKLPWNEPLNEPDADNPVAPVVATIFPVPLIAVVVKLPAEPPPITTWPEVRLSTCKADRFALLPDTITFFQVAILLFVCLFVYKYICFNQDPQKMKQK